MAAINCADCGGKVSDSAVACPHCGAPQAARCPHCGERTVEKVDGLRGLENLYAFVLLLLFIIPGLAYYFDRTRFPWCKTCHRRKVR